MRSAVITVAVLAVLGLAAFGVVSAQKGPAPSAEAVKLAPVAAIPVRVPSTPIQEIAQARAAELPSTATASAPASGSQAAPVRVAQDTSNAAAPAQNAPAVKPAAAGSTAAAAPPSASIAPCDKPGGLGLSRIVEIDTTRGPGFGFEHFKQYDFLRDKEVVLTFDDGPWPENTPAVLRALADNCLKATFFEIGEHATWHPEITKQVVEAGMTLGSHTWSHKDLARNPYAKDIELAKAEIEMGFSAVHNAAGAPIAPFFRFPALQHPPELLAYMSERNIAVFSADFDSRDFKMRKPEEVITSVMTKLEKHGKGIILMHDFRRATAEAMPELLRQLKAGGYKVVHLVPHQMVTTLPKYDEMVSQKDKLSANNTRPEGSVLHTIGEYVGSPPPASAVHE
ncbi:MAG TPA: polysaccharide deacetylase family protein [Xanthobacteraceae bacterium]|jgi:peptidoglycan/xylan/chitin deacetylase (PgdA/CDA1 family)|nr:polysaccharide deacetylase family protein [Xanthobacteraceae bacterium]